MTGIDNNCIVRLCHRATFLMHTRLNKYTKPGQVQRSSACQQALNLTWKRPSGLPLFFKRTIAGPGCKARLSWFAAPRTSRRNSTLENSFYGLPQVIEASKQAGPLACALNVTNHLVGRYEWETRFVFKGCDGTRLSSATIKRWSKYLAEDIEQQLIQKALEHAQNVEPKKIWIYREPIIEASFWPFKTSAK